MLGLPEVTSKDILDLTAMKAGAPKEIAKEVIENAKTVAATDIARPVSPQSCQPLSLLNGST
jgi:hypothetical protein